MIDHLFTWVQCNILLNFSFGELSPYLWSNNKQFYILCKYNSNLSNLFAYEGDGFTKLRVKEQAF